MRLFIFGAGASLASQCHNPNLERFLQAPLVNELFQHHYHKYGVELGIYQSDLDQFQQEVDKFRSLESWLTDKWQGIDKKITSSSKRSERKTFGRISLYLWWLFQNVSESYNGNNIYRKFLKAIVDKQIEFGIINFNYDTLLDRAVEDVLGITLQNLEHYFTNNYVKPHGSVNWFFPRRPSDSAQFIAERHQDIIARYESSSTHMYDGNFDLNNVVVFPPSHKDLKTLELVLSPKFSEQYFYPLIVLPLVTKQYGNVIGFERILEKAKEMVGQASEIFLIGYRAADEIIREILQSVRKEITVHVISKQSPREIQSKVCEMNIKIRQGFGLLQSTGFEHYESILRTIPDPN